MSVKTRKPPVPAQTDTSAGTRGDRRPFALGLGVAMLVALVYCQVPTFDFVQYDDQLHVWQNPHIQHLSWRSVGFFWTHPYQQLYIPISYTLFAALAFIARVPTEGVSQTDALFNPHVFHMASVVLHVANVALVYAILRIATKSDLGAAAGALLFGVHPLQVESVAWISEIRGLLATFFALASLYCYIRLGDKWRPVNYPALALYVLALLSKPSVVTMPLIMLVFDLWVWKKPLKVAALGLVPFVAATLPIVMISHAIQPVDISILTPLWTRPLIALDSLSFYLQKLVWPANLAVDYSRTPQSVIASHAVYVTWLIPAGVAALAIAYRKRFPAGVTALAIIVVAYLPTSGLVPFVFQKYSTTADRYFYLPMLGPAFLTACFVAQYRSRIVLGAVCGALAACATVSVVQAEVWMDTVALFENAALVNPKSFMAYVNIGMGLVDRRQYADAIVSYQKAETLDPNSYIPFKNIAQIQERKDDDYGDALDNYQIASRLNPSDYSITRSIAKMDMKLGHLADADVELQRCILGTPTDPTLYNDLGIVLASQHDYAGASSAFRSAVAIAPTDAGYQGNLARASAALQQTTGVTRHAD